MSDNPDITEKFLADCHDAGIELTVFDGRTAKDFEGFYEDGCYEHVFVTADEAHRALRADEQVLLGRLTELVRAGRDARINLRYEPRPLQGVAVRLADLERSLEPNGRRELREQLNQAHMIGTQA